MNEILVGLGALVGVAALILNYIHIQLAWKQLGMVELQRDKMEAERDLARRRFAID